MWIPSDSAHWGGVQTRAISRRARTGAGVQSNRRPSVENVGEIATQPCQDPGLSRINRGFRDPQFSRDLSSSPIIRRCGEKRPPGGFLKVSLEDALATPSVWDSRAWKSGADASSGCNPSRRDQIARIGVCIHVNRPHAIGSDLSRNRSSRLSEDDNIRS